MTKNPKRESRKTRKSRIRGTYRIFGRFGSTVYYQGKKWKYVDQTMTRAGALASVKRLRKKGYITRTFRNPLSWDIIARKKD